MNQSNELIIKKYKAFLKRQGYSSKTLKECSINKLRQFTADLNFNKITVPIMEKFLSHLKEAGYSDPYIASIGTELRRFFRYLENKGLALNVMAAFSIPANKRERNGIVPLPLDYLKELHKKFHPRW